MPLVTRPFDSARYLDSERAIAEYIMAASESGDPRELAMALCVIAKARGISDLLASNSELAAANSGPYRLMSNSWHWLGL